MSTWISFEEIEAELMKDTDFAEGVRMAEIRLEKRLADERVQCSSKAEKSSDGVNNKIL